MENKRLPEEHVVAALRERRAGYGVGELCRKYGISEATSSHWKAKYAGMAVSDLRKLKALEEENRRLKGDRGGPNTGHSDAAAFAVKNRDRPQ